MDTVHNDAKNIRTDSYTAGTTGGISGSTLKIIAIAAMTIDHVAWFITDDILGSGSIVSVIMHAIGRITFPVMLFLLVEGFCNTRDLKKYILRMAAFAFISEIPFDLCFSGRIFAAKGSFAFSYLNNVFFTLTLSLIAMWALQYCFIKQKPMILGVLAAAVLAYLSHLIGSDYSLFGVISACIMYLLRTNKIKEYAVGSLVLCFKSVKEIPAFLALPLVAKYNGRRGLNMKYFFYIYYPAHLLIIWLIKLIWKI